MKKRSLICLLCAALIMLFSCARVSYIEKDYGKNKEILQTSAPYAADDTAFEFVSRVDEDRAEEIRSYFKANTSLDLYEIAASDKTTWEKTREIALFAASIRHDNQKVQPEDRNVICLWEYCQQYSTGFNCRLHSIFLSELLTAAGIQNRFITCMSSDPEDPDCHVVNVVWLPERNKWAMIDSDMNEYWTDDDGIPMSLEEMRACLVSGGPHIINLLSGGDAPSYIEYLEAYWTKNLYSFYCHMLYCFSLEGKGKNDPEKIDQYVGLIPPGFVDEKGRAALYTTDAERFWAAP